VAYDFSNALKDLPDGYRIGSTNVMVRGSNSNSGSVLFNSSTIASGIVIDTTKYPVYVDFDATTVTPTGGTIALKNTLFIPNPTDSNQYVELDVKDYSSAPKTNGLGKFVEAIAAQVCTNKTCLSGYKNFSLQGCENLSVKSGDIKKVLAGLAGDVSSICEDLDDINNITFQGTGVCGGQNITGLNNIFSFFNNTFNDISTKHAEEVGSLQSTINSLDSRVGSVQGEVSTIRSNPNSFVQGSTSGTCSTCGGSTVINNDGGTTCPNGQCPLNKG